jgi:hypothetical protein
MEPVTLDNSFIITPDDGRPAFPITAAQRDALNRKFLQNRDGSPNFAAFRARSRPGGFGMDAAIVIHWCNMWLAIETDGHTHS